MPITSLCSFRSQSQDLGNKVIANWANRHTLVLLVTVWFAINPRYFFFFYSSWLNLMIESLATYQSFSPFKDLLDTSCPLAMIQGFDLLNFFTFLIAYEDLSSALVYQLSDYLISCCISIKLMSTYFQKI